MLSLQSVLEHLEAKKCYLFPGCYLARDEDGVAAGPFTVKMLEDLDPSTDGNWLRQSPCWRRRS
jgi:hypothetical protein